MMMIDDDMMMMMVMMMMMMMIAYRHPPGSLCLDRHQHRELQEQQDH